MMIPARLVFLVFLVRISGGKSENHPSSDLRAYLPRRAQLDGGNETIAEVVGNQTIVDKDSEVHEDNHDDEDQGHSDDHGAHEDDQDGEDHHGEENHDDHDDHEDHHDKPWAEVIIASIVINLASLAGVLVLISSFFAKKVMTEDAALRQQKGWEHNLIPSFACGALLATTVFLILPESIHMITAGQVGSSSDEDSAHNHRALEGEEDHDDHADTEVAVAWKLGTSILGGFLIPIVTSLAFPHYHEPQPCPKGEEEASNQEQLLVIDAESKDIKDTSSADGSEADPTTLGEVCEDAECCNGENDCADEDGSVHVMVDDKFLPEIAPINYSLATSILLGDFAHNFTDGIFVGAAFTLCQRELAVAITAATVYHELAQEVADYLMLTKHCNLTPITALTCNLLGGFSVMLGALFVVSFDVSLQATGCILAVGGGVYVYIAAGECWPRAQQAQKTRMDKLISLISFVFGAIPIGLVLLNHGHCEE